MNLKMLNIELENLQIKAMFIRKQDTTKQYAF